jgi:hypothetical protein
MRTYFARHTLEVDAATLQELWERPLVAIHYPEDKQGTLGVSDNSSLSPGDYGANAAKIIRALFELSRDGGYVCAEYHGQEKCVLGVVPPATPIQLLEGRWGSGEHEGRRAILTAIPIQRVRRMDPAESAVILVGRPRQGTLSRWPSAGTDIEDLVEGRAPQLRLESLKPYQQEVMCSEYLRDPATGSGLPRLSKLLPLVGHTMRDLDILGLADDGRLLFAQVTKSALQDATGKVSALQQYATRGDHLVLFCDSPATQLSAVTVYPIREVFNYFTRTSDGEAWLKHTLGGA